jgi:hypothetical protein
MVMGDSEIFSRNLEAEETGTIAKLGVPDI